MEEDASTFQVMVGISHLPVLYLKKKLFLFECFRMFQCFHFMLHNLHIWFFLTHPSLTCIQYCSLISIKSGRAACYHTVACYHIVYIWFHHHHSTIYESCPFIHQLWYDRHVNCKLIGSKRTDLRIIAYSVFIIVYRQRIAGGLCPACSTN